MRLEIQNLSLTYHQNLIPPTSYKKVEVLKDVSFTLEPGRIYGLIGRNGAGKTSLLSIISAFNKQSHGDVTVDGTPIFDNGDLMQHIKFVYQKDFSADTESYHPRLLKYIKKENAMRPDFDFEYAEELFKKFNLPTNKKPHKLSKGQMSALQVVIGLSSRAKITIFDEAYIGMDAPTRDLFYKEIIRDQERHPRTIILSTHLVSEMEYLFDDVLIIDKGVLIKQGTYDEIVSNGFSVSGPSSAVDAFSSGKSVLNTETLGSFKKVTLFGELTAKDKILAQDLELEVSTVSLQDLFIHLTGGENHE